MRNYKCASCGKLFDPEKNEICPRCGTAVAPSVLTRIERKRTAQRLRAEGKLNYDEHCHEDDAWKGSYGASTHRAAVRSHEASLRDNYASHKPADNPTGMAAPNPPSVQSTQRQQQRKQNEPAKVLKWIGLVWLLIFLFNLLRSLFRV